MFNSKNWKVNIVWDHMSILIILLMQKKAVLMTDCAKVFGTIDATTAFLIFVKLDLTTLRTLVTVSTIKKVKYDFHFSLPFSS